MLITTLGTDSENLGELAAALPLRTFMDTPFVQVVGYTVIGFQDCFLIHRTAGPRAAEWLAYQMTKSATGCIAMRSEIAATLKPPFATGPRVFRVDILGNYTQHHPTAALAETQCAVINNAFRAWRRIVVHNAKRGSHVR